MSHDVFISHSSKDKTIADGICANLESAGVRCWIAPRDIAAGEDWPRAIANAISESRIMVLIFSANANSSDQISRELSMAANYNLVIVPFKIENVKPEPGKEYYLGRTHWLDAMNPPTQKQISLLVERVKSIIPEAGTGNLEKALLPTAEPKAASQAPELQERKLKQPRAAVKSGAFPSRAVFIIGLIAFGLGLLAVFFRPLSALPVRLFTTSTPSNTTTPIFTAAVLPKPTGTLISMPTPIPLTWKRIAMGQEFKRDLTIALVIDPEDPGVLFVDTQHAGIYKSINGGISWSPIQPNELSNDQALTLKKASSDATQHVNTFSNTAPDGITRLYEFSDFGKGENTYWHVSEDGGTTWSRFSEGGTYSDFSPIAFDKLGAVYVFCGRNICKFSPNGKPLNILREPGIDGQSVLVVSPNDPNMIYAAGNGIAVSKDGGLTWTRLDNGLGSDVLQLQMGTGSPSILYLLLGECFYPGDGQEFIQPLYHSNNGGLTWESLTQEGCFLIRDADGKTLYRHGNREDFEPGINTPLSVIPRAYIWRSSNSGKTWSKIANIPSGIHTLIAHPKQNGLLYAYDNQAPTHQFVSTDYGMSWKDDPSLAIGTCYGATNHLLNDYKPMSIDPQDSNHVLFVESDELWESHDGCSTSNFTQIKFGVTSVISSIAIDTKNPNTLYVGTNIGAYVSFNGGQTWGQVNDGLLGAVEMYSIVIDKDGTVYAATPYGVFKLENK